MNLVYIPQSTIDYMMEWLGPRGWTREQVYDDIKHKMLDVPRVDDSFTIVDGKMVFNDDNVCRTCYVTTGQDWTPVAEG